VVWLVAEPPVLVVCYLIITAKSVMSRHLLKLRVLVVVILAFVGVLRLLRTLGHDHQMLHAEWAPHGEQSYGASRVGYPNNYAINARNDDIYNQKPLENVFGAATNSTRLGFWDVLNKSYVDQHVPRPWIGSYQCKDVICSEFLHNRDWIEVDKFMKAMEKEGLLNISPACHFMNGTSRGSVALLSFPGSGNTWLRGLLEKATGICTGEGILPYQRDYVLCNS